VDGLATHEVGQRDFIFVSERPETGLPTRNRATGLDFRGPEI